MYDRIFTYVNDNLKLSCVLQVNCTHSINYVLDMYTLVSEGVSNMNTMGTAWTVSKYNKSIW